MSSKNSSLLGTKKFQGGELFSSRGGTDQFLRSFISLLRSFISFFRRNDSSLGGESEIPPKRFLISSGVELALGD